MRNLYRRHFGYHGEERIGKVSDQYSDKNMKYHTQFDRKAKVFGHQVSFDGNIVVSDNMC